MKKAKNKAKKTLVRIFSDYRKKRKRELEEKKKKKHKGLTNKNVAKQLRVLEEEGY